MCPSFGSLKSEAPKTVYRKVAGALPSFLAPNTLCGITHLILREPWSCHPGGISGGPGYSPRHQGPQQLGIPGEGPPTSVLTSTRGSSYTSTGSALFHPPFRYSHPTHLELVGLRHMEVLSPHPITILTGSFSHKGPALSAIWSPSIPTMLPILFFLSREAGPAGVHEP